MHIGKGHAGSSLGTRETRGEKPLTCCGGCTMFLGADAEGDGSLLRLPDFGCTRSGLQGWASVPLWGKGAMSHWDLAGKLPATLLPADTVHGSTSLSVQVRSWGRPPPAPEASGGCRHEEHHASQDRIFLRSCVCGGGRSKLLKNESKALESLQCCFN